MTAGHWDGAEYERVSGLQRHVAQLTLSRLVLRGDERVLDVGCGDGFITRSIAARVPAGSVLGVDASPAMIGTAAARPGPPGSDVTFAVGDVLTLAFDAEFGLVVSFNTLHWVVNQGAALARMTRALRPGGRIVVQLVCDGDRPSVEDIAAQTCGEPRWAKAFSQFRPPYLHVAPADFRRVAGNAGLAVADLQVDDLSWTFPARADFAHWCSVGFADWTAHLDEESAARWVEDVVDRYQAVVGEPGLFRFLQLRAELLPVRPSQPVGS